MAHQLRRRARSGYSFDDAHVHAQIAFTASIVVDYDATLTADEAARGARRLDDAIRDAIRATLRERRDDRPTFEARVAASLDHDARLDQATRDRERRARS